MLLYILVPTLLERCPAFFMDYVHYTEIPDDITPERLAEFGSCYEHRYKNGFTIELVSYVQHR